MPSIRSHLVLNTIWDPSRTNLANSLPEVNFRKQRLMDFNAVNSNYASECVADQYWILE